MRFARGMVVAMMGLMVGGGTGLADTTSAAGPGTELRHLRLLVSLPPEELGSGTLVYAPSDPRPRTFLEMLTEGGRAGDLGQVPEDHRAGVAEAIDDYMPDRLAERAVQIFRTKEELRNFLQEKIEAATPIEGIYHCSFTEESVLSLTGFRGDALISFDGPVRLGDVTLEEAGRDQLTLVSARSIHVEGERVEAGLVSLVPGIGQVSFEGPAFVRGFVFSALFPAGTHLGEVQIAH